MTVFFVKDDRCLKIGVYIYIYIYIIWYRIFIDEINNDDSSYHMFPAVVVAIVEWLC